MKPVNLLLLTTMIISISGLIGVAYAQEESGGGSSDGSKLGGAGVGLGYVGSAGLAVISENPALQSKVFIFIGMVESIAIYGIVMMFIILGQYDIIIFLLIFLKTYIKYVNNILVC